MEIYGCDDWIAFTVDTLLHGINIKSVVPTLTGKRAPFNTNIVQEAEQGQYVYLKYVAERKGCNKFSNALERTCISFITNHLYIFESQVYIPHILRPTLVRSIIDYYMLYGKGPEI